MSKLWFDPSADVAGHDPPLKPLDPSRPIRRAPAVAQPATFDWANYVGGVFVAPEKDPA
jgi:hypothetical protein